MGPRPTIAELRRVCQDPIRGGMLRHDPLYRRFSIYLTRAAVGLKLTPHQVTLISLLAGLFAGALLCELTPWRLLSAIPLLQLYLILDHVDGELARWTKRASMGGRFLEQAGCSAADPFLLLGLSIGVEQSLPQLPATALGVVGALTQVYFRMCPVILNATLTNVYMAARHRHLGEATPEPEASDEGPDPGPWGRRMEALYPLYSRLRFPYFHPNFLLLLSLVAAGDAALSRSGSPPWLSAALVIGYGLTTPVMTVWQVMNILSLRLTERRYRALYVRGESFREHI